MEQKRENELVRLLNEYDVSGVSFINAKNKLLAKGFTEKEIVYALYSAPFDGKVNKPQAGNPLHEFYEQYPERAE